MGAELLHADRQTDLKPTVAFRSFAKAPLPVPYTTMNTAGYNGTSAGRDRSVFTIGSEIFFSPCNHPITTCLHSLPLTCSTRSTLNMDGSYVAETSVRKNTQRHVSKHCIASLPQ